MKLPSLPLFTDTFIAETAHLTNEQIGMYMRLLCFAWTKKGKPFTTDSAYKICQCKDDKCIKKVLSLLNEFFEPSMRDKDTQQWIHNRIVTEINYLLDYYSKKSQSGKRGVQAKRNFASSESQAPIPIPIPIPTNTNGFFEFWDNLLIKRGSKKNAEKSYKRECSDFNPLKLAKLFNYQTSKIQDKQFVPHVVTWINGRRFEDEDLKETGPTLIERMQKLGYKSRGSEGDYEQFIKDGKNYRLHKYKEKAEIELEP